MGVTAPAPQPREECAPTGRGAGEGAGRPASGGAAPRLVINLVGEGARDVSLSDMPMSDFDFHGTSREVASVAVPTLLESVLDEIDCVDDFGPESEDPGGDSDVPESRRSCNGAPRRVTGDCRGCFGGRRHSLGARRCSVRDP